MRKIVLLLMLLSLSGCVAMGGAKFSQDAYIAPDRAVVYVYREMALQSIGECYAVYVDNTKLGCVKAGGYLRYEVQPGMHLVSLRNPLDNNEFMGAHDKSLKGGQAYYFKATPLEPFREVTEAQALQQITSLSEQENMSAAGL